MVELIGLAATPVQTTERRVVPAPEAPVALFRLAGVPNPGEATTAMELAGRAMAVGLTEGEAASLAALLWPEPEQEAARALAFKTLPRRCV